jgi:hypothetical protein
MGNRILFTPLRYLRLRDEGGRLLLTRNLFATLLLAALFSLPFLVVSTSNYFHKDGFIDKLGSFSSVLTGFYVAGLLAVATFSAKLGDLDTPMDVGPAILPKGAPDEKDIHLTRREYVCTIFGYLAFLSLFTTLISITVVILTSGISAVTNFDLAVGKNSIHFDREIFRSVPILLFGLLAAHLAVVTCHSLYYLMDRLYAQKPKLLPERTQTTENEDA